MSISLEEVERYILVYSPNLYAEEEDGRITILTTAKGKAAQAELRAARAALASMEKRKKRLEEKGVINEKKFI